MLLHLSTVEAGISDHHSIICTMLCSTFCKTPSKFIYYRFYNNYNKYNKEQLENVLKQRLVSSSNVQEFLDTFLATLNKNAPLKKKHFDIIIKSLCVKRFARLS